MEADQKFDSFNQWVNKASSWLTRHPMHSQFFKAICFDSKGRICSNGGDMAKARDEDAFPVYWIWPDQNLFNVIDSIERQQNDRD